MKKKKKLIVFSITALCLIFLLAMAASVIATISAIPAQVGGAWATLSEEGEDGEEEEISGDIQAGIVKGKRTSYPSSDNPFYFSAKYNPWVGTAWGPPALTHNCTWYAYGRFSEILGRKASGIYTGNAAGWYAYSTGFKKGKTPKVGAIVCWRYTNDPYGHVAVVEEIKSNGDIVTSNSGWRGGMFWMQTWTKASGYQGGVYRLNGFIYQP